jgi:phosphorylase kinase alpha/beta subunit
MGGRNERVVFHPDAILATMETLRRPNGAFVASVTPDYQALWLRDHLYCTLAYWYLGHHEKLREGVWLIFDLFKRYAEKVKRRAGSPVDVPGGVIHAKFHPDTLDEITTDDGWGHDQLDAIGLFLHVVADLDFKNIQPIRDRDDLEILQLLVYYLRSVEYWHRHDFGMWEECRLIHASSIGAVVGGLTYLRKQNLAIVSDQLILAGEEALRDLFPHESRPDRCNCPYCRKHFHEKPHHAHDCDSALLSLIWPYHVITKRTDQEYLLNRILSSHLDLTQTPHSLVQHYGIQRYWGDDYYRAGAEYGWVSAQWPMFFFWAAIDYAQLGEIEKAAYWFRRGASTITPEQAIPEAYTGGMPNDHTPLAWAHALALIAWSKLPERVRDAFAP